MLINMDTFQMLQVMPQILIMIYRLMATNNYFLDFFVSKDF